MDVNANKRLLRELTMEKSSGEGIEEGAKAPSLL